MYEWVESRSCVEALPNEHLAFVRTRHARSGRDGFEAPAERLFYKSGARARPRPGARRRPRARLVPPHPRLPV